MFPFFCVKEKVVEVKGADDTLTRISSNFKLVAAPENYFENSTFKTEYPGLNLRYII